MSWVSHPDISEIMRVPGYCFWNPSALDVEANWGTKLGYSLKGVEFESGLKVVPVKYEVTGNQTRHLIYCGANPRAIVTLRSYNSTALARLFPGLVSDTRVTFPGSTRSGTDLMNTHTGTFLFVPDDRGNSPALLITSCAPAILETAQIVFSNQEEMVFPCMFWMKTSAQLGFLEDLSL
jgi:hypothetical protein